MQIESQRGNCNGAQGGAYDAGVCASEAVGPSGGGSALVALDANLDLSACVHVSDELHEGGGKDLGRSKCLGAAAVAHATAFEGLSKPPRVTHWRVFFELFP